MRTNPTRGKLNQWVIQGGRCLNCCTRQAQESARLVTELAEAIESDEPGAIAFIPAPPRGPEIGVPRTPPVIRKLPVGRVGPGAIIIVGAIVLEQLLAAIDTQTLVSMLLETSNAILKAVDGCEDCVRERLLGQEARQQQTTVHYAKRQ